MKKMFFKIVVAFILGASLGFLVGIKKMANWERRRAECECVEWECEEKLDNILLKERN